MYFLVDISSNGKINHHFNFAYQSNSTYFNSLEKDHNQSIELHTAIIQFNKQILFGVFMID